MNGHVPDLLVSTVNHHGASLFPLFLLPLPTHPQRIIWKHTKARRVVFEPETSGVSEVRGARKS